MAKVSKEYYEFKKASIIDASLEVCKRKTVGSVTMQDIIDEAGISQGGIYRYYKNIDEVLIDLLSRIRIEQYESINRLNNVIEQNIKDVIELRNTTIDDNNVIARRARIARIIKEIHNVWVEELEKYLYPHKKIQLDYMILADNFPDRARVIFPNASEEKSIDGRIMKELRREIEDGIITPRITLQEFMEYNTSVYWGIINRAISVNCYQRTANFNKRNDYDIKKRYETFAKSSAFFLGVEEYIE